MPRLLRAVPSIITTLRIILGVCVFIAADQHAWVLAFWLFITALITDFFDGFAARKLHVQHRLGAEFDAAADAFTVAAGMLGLAAAGVIPLWVAAVALIIGGIIGSERHLPRQLRPAPAVGKVAAVSCLFVAWVGIGWVLANQAYGWKWWYVLLTFLILGACARLKRHRIRAWLQGLD